jgi:hypothetical protein
LALKGRLSHKKINRDTEYEKVWQMVRRDLKLVEE